MLLRHGQTDESRGYTESNHLFAKGNSLSSYPPIPRLTFISQSQFLVPIIWVASITFIRASIVFLYIRVFPTRIFRRICYAVLAINFLFFVGTVLADCLICQPISYRWDRVAGGSGHCGDQKSLDLFIGIFNLVLDIVAVVLPMPILWGLKMAVTKKVMLSGMFGMGTVYVLPFRPPVVSNNLSGLR